MRVANIRTENYTHYIGRMSSWPGNGKPTQLGNPFVMQDATSRNEVIAAFEAHARRTPELLAKIRELPQDAVLGCWCAPKPCHGDVIVKLWKEMHDVP